MGVNKDSLPECLGGTWSKDHVANRVNSSELVLKLPLSIATKTKEHVKAVEPKEEPQAISSQGQPDPLTNAGIIDFDPVWDAEIYEAETPDERRERKRKRDAAYSKNRRKMLKATEEQVTTEHYDVLIKNDVLKNENKRLRELVFAAKSLARRQENPVPPAPTAQPTVLGAAGFLPGRNLQMNSAMGRNQLNSLLNSSSALRQLQTQESLLRYHAAPPPTVRLEDLLSDFQHSTGGAGRESYPVGGMATIRLALLSKYIQQQNNNNN
jgi:hypothetical protein